MKVKSLQNLNTYFSTVGICCCLPSKTNCGEKSLSSREITKFMNDKISVQKSLVFLL